MTWILFLVLQDPSPEAVRTLIERLGSDAPAERMEAERRLEDAGLRFLPDLRRAAESDDAEVSARAGRLVRVISVTGRVTPAMRSAVPDAVRRLLEGSPSAWTELFLEAAPLGKVGPEDLAPLVPFALAGAGEGQALAILNVVGQRKIPSVAPEVMAVIRARGVPVRLAGLQVVRACGGKEVLLEIRSFLQDPVSTVRGEAAFMLVELEGTAAVPHLVPLLKSPWSEMQRTAIDALRRLPARDAVGAFRETLVNGRAPGRGMLVALLPGVCGKEAAPVLAELLRDPDADVRYHAVRGLVEVDGKDVGSALVPLLEDSDGAVREAAVEAAGRLGVEASVPFLVRLLGDLDPSIRLGALTALAEIGARDQSTFVVELLADPSDAVRMRAGEALVAMGAGRAAGEVRRYLGSSRAEVRATAASVLGRLKDRDGVGPLVRQLGDENAEARGAAAEALGEMAAREAIPPLSAALRDADSGVARKALLALEQLGARSEVARIAALLERGREELWEDALRVLGTLGAREQIPAVAAILEKGCEPVVRTAVLVLEELEAREEIPRLRSLLAHWSMPVRVEAAFALASLGSDDGVDVLLESGTRLIGLNGLRNPAAWKTLRWTPVREPAPDEEESFFESAVQGLGLQVRWDAAFWPPQREEIAKRYFQSGGALVQAFEADGAYGAILEEDGVRVLPSRELPRFWKRHFRRLAGPGETVVGR